VGIDELSDLTKPFLYHILSDEGRVVTGKNPKRGIRPQTEIVNQSMALWVLMYINQ
jgi:hypothetical protein